MKKGLLIALAVTVVITAGAAFAFADSSASGMMDIRQMNEMHKSMVEQQVKDGKLTPEQAKAMDEHMAEMNSMTNGMMGTNASCHSSQQNPNAIPQQ